MDLKSRNKSIRLLPNRIQQTTNGHDQQSNLLRKKNQDITQRPHPPPADLLLISQQNKTHLPPISNERRKHKTPNKENIENSQTRHGKTSK